MCRYISFICFLIWSYHHQFSKFSATVSLYLSYILFSSLNSKHLHRLFKNTNWRIYLLIYERERDIDQLPSECALNGDWTPSLPVYGTMLQPMRDLARAPNFFFFFFKLLSQSHIIWPVFSILLNFHISILAIFILFNIRSLSLSNVYFLI